MLRGKKVMHLSGEPGFDYLPGETVIIPGNVEMKIDFPEASAQNPTQCLALAIDHDKITDTLDFLNERYPKEDTFGWRLNHENYFFYNNTDLAATINKLIRECMGTSITKDALVDLALQELLVRIIQTQTAEGMSKGRTGTTSPIHAIADFVRANITKNINLKQLSEKACMSTTSFYRYFKKETGMSPIEFILSEKIKHAKHLLKTPGIQVNEVCFMAGFDDCNYFIRLFKKHEGITPKQYQQLFIN
jgi:AraC-like DNA-binding protein